MDEKLQNPNPGKSTSRPRHRKKAIELNMQVTCKLCGKFYKSYNGLKTHVRHVHQGIRYQCSLCDKTYARRTSLHKHRIDVHLPRGQHPYRCAVCDEGFQRWIELHRHKKTHQDPIELPCDKCSQIFNSSKALKEHVKGSHTERKWQFAQRNFHYRNKYGAVITKLGIRTSHSELKSRITYRK